MKRLLALLLSLFIIIPIINAGVLAADVVASGSCGESVTFTLDTDGNLVISGEGAMSFEEYGTAPWDTYKVKAVIVNGGVTELCDYAFAYCDSLLSVSLPWSLQKIGGWAFFECKSLENIVIPDSVGSVGYSAFGYCESLKSIDIPYGVTEIGMMAFAYCNSLENASISSSVTKIESGCFAGCSSLSDIVVDPMNVYYYSEGNCLIEKASGTLVSASVSSVIPGDGSIKHIGDFAFDGLQGLKTVSLPEGVESICARAFGNCADLESVSLPESLSTISDSVFNDCTSLKEVSIPEGVEELGTWCFAGCSALDSVSLPESLKSVGNYAFGECSSLEEIDLPDNVTVIEGRAFDGCSSLKSVGLPRNLEKIEYNAFGNCTSIESIDLPEGLTQMEEGVFENCTSLKAITIPDSVTEISEGCFQGCTSLREVTVGEGNELYESVDGNLIDKATKTIIIGSRNGVIPDEGRVERIGAFAFGNNNEIETITIPGTVKVICENAFSECGSLREVILSEGIEEIGEFAFYGCILLPEIKLPVSLKIIGNNVFAGCESFNTIKYDGTVFDRRMMSVGIYNIILNEAQWLYNYTNHIDVTERFTDVNPGRWYVDCIDFVVNNGLFSGTGKNTFSPSAPMSRAMLVTVIYRAEGSPEVEYSDTFSDVPAGKWYSDAVIWVAQNGIVTGVGNSLFKPDAPLTREQCAVILYRYYTVYGGGLFEGNNEFDASGISPWAVEAMNWAVSEGLIIGDGKGLNPKANATRAEVSNILKRHFMKF